jgi:hypothetical protein
LIDAKALSAADIAVGVFTSALNLRERALSVQNTWLGSFPNAYLIGGWFMDPGLRMVSLGEGVGEDYRSAHRKQFLGLLELRRRFPQSKWFFITGCDAYVFAENLAALLSEFDSRDELLIGGHCGEASVDGESLIFASGGPGFAVSSGLVDAIAGRIPDFVEEWAARPDLCEATDVAMAYLAKRERGVSVTFRDGFYFLPPYAYPGTSYLDGSGRRVDGPPVQRPIAYHSLTIREMYALARGEPLSRPGPIEFCFDILSKLLVRKMHTRAIVNRAARSLFG